MALMNRLDEIKAKINGIDSFIKNCTNLLRIKDENGYIKDWWVTPSNIQNLVD
jgi:hypothetical protein